MSRTGITIGLVMALVLAGAARASAAPFAYITNTNDGTVSVIDTATNTVTATVPVQSYPIGVTVTPDGSRAYVGNLLSNSVSVISTATNTVISTITGLSSPQGIAASPDGSRVYVTNSGNGTVSVISTATNAVIATVPVGTGPIGVAVSPDGSRVYVANEAAGAGTTLSVISTATNTVTATVTGLSSPWGVAVSPDGSKVYVSNLNGFSLSVISTATNTVTATVPIGTYPRGVVVTPDGSTVYVANDGNSTVSVISTATNAVTATVTGFLNPFGVAITPNGASVYVANQVPNNVLVIPTATNMVSAAVSVGNNPVTFGQFIGPVLGPLSDGVIIDGTNAGATFSLYTGGVLTATNESIGNTTSGSFYQYGGSNTVSSNLTVGNATGGSYLLAGGTLTVGSKNMSVGFASTGLFTQNGGLSQITNGGGLIVGVSATGVGTYDLNDGTLTADFATIGQTGTGTFNQNGGAVTLNGHLTLGAAPGSTGMYTLTGGTLTSVGNGSDFSGNVTVGGGGMGTFIQNGGTNLITTLADGHGNDLLLGGQSTGTGTYTLNDGGLMARGAFVGYVGVGTFTQNGGTVTLSPFLVIGSNSPTATGTYTLNAGSLTTGLGQTASGAEFVGQFGTGTFIQNGGTHQIVNDDGLVLGDFATGNGTYELNAGSLVAGSVTIGQNGTGIFTQKTGSSVTFALFVRVGADSGSRGTYNLMGGSLTLTGTANEDVGDGGIGAFTQSGGSNTIMNGGLLLGVASTGNGTYTLGGGSLTAGFANVGQGGTGTLTQNGGSVGVGGLRVGNLLGSNGTYTLNAGMLTLTALSGAGNENIGFDGAGSFTQAGGTNTIPNGNGLRLGIDSTGIGMYAINAGSLSSGFMTLGRLGIGAFIQNGGTVNVTGALFVGAGSTGVGTLNLSGGALNSASGIIGNAAGSTGIVTVAGPGSWTISAGDLDVGEGGRGSLTIQSGGVVSNTSASNAIVIGDQAGSVGSVAVSGTGSHLNASGPLTVGGLGQGTLLVENGGTALSTNMNVGPLGQVTVSNGTLQAAGPAGVTVQTGGILRGYGTIKGAVTNNGTVAPGGPGQTVSVDKSYTQAATGTLAIEANPTTASSLAAGKSATLAGTLALTFDPGTYASSATYAIVTAKKGVSGTFGTTQTVSGATYLGGLVPTLTYTPSQVTLGFDPLSAFAATPNQLAVASSLQQTLSTTTGGDLVAAFAALVSGPPSQLQAAYNAMAGTAYTALPTVAINTLDAAAAAVFGHWDGTGPGLAGARMLPAFSFGGTGGWMSGDSTGRMSVTGSAPVVEASGGASALWGTSGVSGDAAISAGSGFWAQALGGNVPVTGWGDPLAAANAKISGTLMGYDSVLSPRLRIGTALGRWQSGVTMSDGTGQSTAMSTGLVAAYAQYAFGDWTLDALAGSTSDTVQVARPMTFVGRTATANYTTNDTIAALQVGRRLQWGGVTVLPTVGVDYVQAVLPTVSESGADSLNLTVAGQSVTSVRGVVGLRLAGPVDGATFQWTAYVNYGHEFGTPTFATTATLAGAPGNPFTVTGVNAAADTWGAGVGLNWRLRDNAEFRVTYDALLSAPQMSQAGSVTLDLHF